MSANLTLLHPVDKLPDTFTELVRHLNPDVFKAAIPPLGSGTPHQRLRLLENYLDRQEIRRTVLLGHGSGAPLAVLAAYTTPNRFSHLVLSAPSFPDPALIDTYLKSLRLTPKFLLRRRGVDREEMVAALTQARDIDWPALCAGLTQPGLIFGELPPDLATAVRSSNLRGAPPISLEQDPAGLLAQVTELLNLREGQHGDGGLGT